MTDTLKEMSYRLGRARRDVEFLERRGGLLPAVDRTRGSLVEFDGAYIAHFTIDNHSRRVGLKLSFHKLAIS